MALSRLFATFDGEHAVQTITFRLGDSLPQQKLHEFKRELLLIPDRSKREIELRKKMERWIDAGYGACHLRDARIGELVQNALLFFDGERYRLLEWVIMPNHVHAIIETYGTSPGSPELNEARPTATIYTLAKILHSWKSFTSNRANTILNREGTFWDREYFDRYIRSETHLAFAIKYIRENPVKAGLCAQPEDWPWSSASYGAPPSRGNLCKKQP